MTKLEILLLRSTFGCYDSTHTYTAILFSLTEIQVQTNTNKHPNIQEVSTLKIQSFSLILMLETILIPNAVCNMYQTMEYFELFEI